MKRNVDVWGRTAVISTDTISVRAINYDGATLFSATDIVRACGKKDPSSWVRRHSRNNDIAVTRMPCDVMTKGGIRTLPINLCTPDVGRSITQNVCRDRHERDFLIEQVLTYRFDSDGKESVLSEQEVHSEPTGVFNELEQNREAVERRKKLPVVPAETPNTVKLSADAAEIASAIDKVLVALLELKQKMCACQ